MQQSKEAVYKQLAYRPFRVFWLETLGGTAIRVARPEWFHEMPQGPLIINDEAGAVTLTWWTDLNDTIRIETPEK